MDPEAEQTQSSAQDDQQLDNTHIDNALRAIREKKPLPEIDFTIHTMEDGTQVNTAERVCKGAHSSPRIYPATLDPSGPA